MLKLCFSENLLCIYYVWNYKVLYYKILNAVYIAGWKLCDFEKVFL